jgi:hypothetical protein
VTDSELRSLADLALDGDAERDERIAAATAVLDESDERSADAWPPDISMIDLLVVKYGRGL